MKWGFQKKMLTVRELFGKMRTHSAACTVAAAGLAAVVCGVIVIRAVGGIAFDDGSEPVPSRDDEILSMMETDDAILMGQNEAMRLQLDTMFVSLQTLRENVSSGTRVIETIERSLHEMNGVDESARDKCREMNGTLAELEDMMADAFSEISEISALCADDAPYDAEKRKELAGRIGKLNAAMAKIVDRYATVSTDVASLTTRLRDYGAGASEYRKAVDVLQESLASGRSEVSGLSAQIGQMGEQIHGTQNSMLEQLNASIAQMNRLSEQIVTSNMTVEGLSGQVFGSNRTIEALSEQVQSSGLTVEALGEQVMASGRSVGELSEQVLASNRSIGELSGQVLQTNQTVEELSGQVLASNRMVEELSGQVLASTQTINALAEQLDASTRTIDELNIQLGEAKAELGGLREQVSATNTSVETVAAEIAGQAKAAGEAQARGTGYITVTFELTTYTFDFSPYVANHAALTGRDIMVRNFSANAAGSSQYHMGISANINMDNAVYDPSTGRLTINDVYLMSPFLSSTGTVTFAVIGGIAR